MQRISLGTEERRRLKVEAVGGRAYAECVSTSLALLLIALRAGRGDDFPVLVELDFLEGIKGKDPDVLLARLHRQCAAEWPFLFGECAG